MIVVAIALALIGYVIVKPAPPQVEAKAPGDSPEATSLIETAIPDPLGKAISENNGDLIAGLKQLASDNPKFRVNFSEEYMGQIAKIEYDYVQGSKYNLTDESFKHLAGRPELERLQNLGINSPESAGGTDSCLASFKGYPHLHGLYLSGFITDVGIKYIADNMQGTEKLSIKGNFTRGGIQELGKLIKIFNLTIKSGSQLDLSNPQSINFLDELPKLKQLSFMGSAKFSDLTIDKIASVSAPSLTQLRLYMGKGSTVTDQAMMHLSKLNGLSDLYLELPAGYRGLTSQGFVHFKPMQNLKTIKLKNCHIQNTALAALRQSLPNCKITHDVKE